MDKISHCLYMKEFSEFGTKTRKNATRLRSYEQPVFGPYIWTAFHLMAHNYPLHPNKTTQLRAKQFINAIPWMLPCSNCGYHLKHFIEKEYLPNSTNKFAHITKTRETMMDFFVAAHNNVTEHTDPQKKPWTTKKANQYYKWGYRQVPKSIKPWETAALRRNKSKRCKQRVTSGKRYCKLWEV